MAAKSVNLSQGVVGSTDDHNVAGAGGVEIVVQVGGDAPADAQEDPL